MILLGKIVNTHGLKGEVRILSNSDQKEKRFKSGNELIINANTKLKIQFSKMHKQFIIVKFEGIDNINDVEKYKNSDIYTNEIIDTEENEFYFFDLKKCKCFDSSSGDLIGEVIDVHEFPRSAMLEVLYNDKKILIPFQEEFIGNVDIDKGIIEVKVIEGLL